MFDAFGEYDHAVRHVTRPILNAGNISVFLTKLSMSSLIENDIMNRSDQRAFKQSGQVECRWNCQPVVRVNNIVLLRLAGEREFGNALHELKIKMQEHSGHCGRLGWRRKMHAFDSDAVTKDLMLIALDAVGDDVDGVSKGGLGHRQFMDITAKPENWGRRVFAGQMKNPHGHSETSRFVHIYMLP